MLDQSRQPTCRAAAAKTLLELEVSKRTARRVARPLTCWRPPTDQDHRLSLPGRGSQSGRGVGDAAGAEGEQGARQEGEGPPL